MDEEFQQLQRNFMDKYYLEFENTEENKLIYTSIFQEYIDLLEKYIEQQLIEKRPAFNMTTFITSLQQHKDEISGDIFDMLLTFTDFLAFKEMFLDYRMLLICLLAISSILKKIVSVSKNIKSAIIEKQNMADADNLKRREIVGNTWITQHL
ncbi:ADP-ribosylation factor-like protein 2-binding protein isoform X2 [Chiloscyllium plagiosum]|uniref:ADP-ribosylation factor-like protein 2-binding protein isoform X2 n=1 Tax=Chiloscyllium plagiosum TaxID=36176 RepID=UPI001CB7D19A|nr:ADP-ribosylation factor-like protein 2-binding protein isoform X2 [Chiloscyllium plagiosum]